MLVSTESRDACLQFIASVLARNYRKAQLQVNYILSSSWKELVIKIFIIKKKHVQKQNVWTYNFLHISIYYVYTKLSNYTNSKRHLLKKQRLKRSVLTGGRM